jgi:hypothetical protein
VVQWGRTGQYRPTAAPWRRPGTDRAESTYSVEKLSFGAEAIFQFYGNAAENPWKTRRTADWERLRAEIVNSGCSLESRKSPAFYSATIFPPNTRREFFNRIDPLQALANGRYRVTKTNLICSPPTAAYRSE